MSALPDSARDRQCENRTGSCDDAVDLSELRPGAGGRFGQEKPVEAPRARTDVVSRKTTGTMRTAGPRHVLAAHHPGARTNPAPAAPVPPDAVRRPNTENAGRICHAPSVRPD